MDLIICDKIYYERGFNIIYADLPGNILSTDLIFWERIYYYVREFNNHEHGFNIIYAKHIMSVDLILLWMNI